MIPKPFLFTIAALSMGGVSFPNNGPAPRPEPSPEPPPESTAPAVPVADIGRRQRARAADRKARKAARHQR